MTHDDDDRRTGHQLVCGVLVVVKEALLDGDDDLALDLAAELDRDEFRRVKVDGLVDTGHDAVFHEALDDLGGGLFHARGKLAHGDLVGDLHDELRLLGDLELETAHLFLLLGAGFAAEFLALLLLFVLVADLLLAALIILHAVGDERIDAVVIAVGVDRDGAGIDDAALTLALGLRLLRLLRGLLRAVLRLRLLRSCLLLRCGRSCLSGCGRLGCALLRRSGRLLRGGSLLRLCGGKDLLQRCDLMVLGDIIKNDVQLFFRKILRTALGLREELSHGLDDVLRVHREVVRNLFDLVLDFHTATSCDYFPCLMLLRCAFSS